MSRLLVRLGRFLLRAGLLGMLLVAAYFLAALVLGCIPLNRHFRNATHQGAVKVWVISNEIHADLVVPIRNEIFDWSTLVDCRDVQRPDEGCTSLEIGLGDRRFYLECPTWADAKVSIMLGAFCGLHSTAMHVTWLKGDFENGPRCRSLSLDGEQYRQLCLFMSASFTRDASQRAIHIPAPGYTTDDAFYEAQGRYNTFETCNTWTGRALAAAGVRVGVWTPMRWGVFWQLPAPSPNAHELRQKRMPTTI